MSDERRVRESLAELRRRIDAIPAALDAASTVPLPAPPPALERVVVTGIGGSEGPARLLAELLAACPRPSARFVPLAAFRAGRAPQADLLVVFSQGLSPNADLALRSPTARARWLVTSVGYGGVASTRLDYLRHLERAGVEPIPVPPGVESGMLARVVGPEVASLLALRLAALLGGAPTLPLAEAAAAYRVPHAVPVLPERDVALVTDAASAEWAFGLRWKLLEGLLLPDPPVWDALQLAHGPLQSFYERALTLLVLETPASGDLVERLRAVLHPERHRLVRLSARRADALGYFDHAAAIDALVLATLEARPRDLFDWPARGRDGALYGLTGDEPGADGGAAPG